MLNKILFIVTMVCISALWMTACPTFAQYGLEETGKAANLQQQEQEQMRATSDSGTQNQVQNENQTQNQGEETQLQNAEQQMQQEQSVTNTGVGAQNEIQNQNQVQNQGEETQVKTAEQQREQEQQEAVQRRSSVANAVQEMLQVADRNGGIGEQVRVIAQEQNQNHEKVEASLKKVEGRSRLVKFLIGPDLNEIENAEEMMTRVEAQVAQLRQIKTNLRLKTDQQKMDEQLQLLEQTQLQIRTQLEESKGGFSLLGWALKLFRR